MRRSAFVVLLAVAACGGDGERPDELVQADRARAKVAAVAAQRHLEAQGFAARSESGLTAPAEAAACPRPLGLLAGASGETVGEPASSGLGEMGKDSDVGDGVRETVSVFTVVAADVDGADDLLAGFRRSSEVRECALAAFRAGAGSRLGDTDLHDVRVAEPFGSGSGDDEVGARISAELRAEGRQLGLELTVQVARVGRGVAGVVALAYGSEGPTLDAAALLATTLDALGPDP